MFFVKYYSYWFLLAALVKDVRNMFAKIILEKFHLMSSGEVEINLKFFLFFFYLLDYTARPNSLFTWNNI